MNISLKNENTYQITNKHYNKYWYYTVRIKRVKTGKVKIGMLEKNLAVDFEKRYPIK